MSKWKTCYRCRKDVLASAGRCPCCGCVAFFRVAQGRSLQSLAARDDDARADQQDMLRAAEWTRGNRALTARRTQRTRGGAE